MFASWFDQKRDLSTLNAVLAHGRADAIADNGIGPAYIAVAALLHDALGLSPENALVALTRGSYALSVVAGMILVRVLVRRLVATPGLVSLAAQIVFVAFVFAAGTWHWSDVPWSHFFAMCLAVGSLRVAVRSGTLPARSCGGGRGAPRAPCTQPDLRARRARRCLRVRRAPSRRSQASRPAHLDSPPRRRGRGCVHGHDGARLSSRRASVTSSSSTATTSTSSRATSSRRRLHRRRRSASPSYRTSSSSSSSSPATTRCARSPTTPEGPRPLPPALAEAAGNERLWRLPLAIQLPSLVLLPLCIVVVAALVVWMARHRSVAAGRERSLRLLVELTTRRDRARPRLRGEHDDGLAAPALRLRARLPAPGAPRHDRRRRARVRRAVAAARASLEARDLARVHLRRPRDRRVGRARRGRCVRASERNSADREQAARADLVPRTLRGVAVRRLARRCDAGRRARRDPRGLGPDVRVRE